MKEALSFLMVLIVIKMLIAIVQIFTDLDIVSWGSTDAAVLLLTIEYLFKDDDDE
jgi:hypothetical protein